MILPLLGERAGVRARSLQPRHEALVKFVEREKILCLWHHCLA
jgi:hypothetical protein